MALGLDEVKPECRPCVEDAKVAWEAATDKRYAMKRLVSHVLNSGDFSAPGDIQTDLLALSATYQTELEAAEAVMQVAIRNTLECAGNCGRLATTQVAVTL